VRLVLGILGAVFTVAYPLVVYVGLQRWPPHVLGLALLGLFGVLFVLRRLSRRGAGAEPGDRTNGWASGWPDALPLLAAGLLLLGVLLRQGMFVKAVPVLVSGGLLTVFGLSLRGPCSLVERFARRQDPELTPAKVRYCRQVTVVWCWFFVLNIAITLGLAVAAPLSWWTLYTGVVAYVLIGGLFTAEYVVRKARFRDYGSGWHDRALAAVFPPRSE
jgi:uncharacterized membrane protein